MMKPRSNQAATMSGRNKPEQSGSNGATSATRNQAQLNSNQPTAAQNIRKRRSSINVYDQPSSLNSRLRQLETDMLRLDEDRAKLFDDTHSALAQYELKLSEIHAILKSRQDNVEKYVEDMKMLLQAKDEFERQTKLLNEKHDRIHEKFMHRETTISREIKLLKNKFDLLEKSRQFRSLLQKSPNNIIGTSGASQVSDDLASGLDSSEFQKTKSDAGALEEGEMDNFSIDPRRASSSGAAALSGVNNKKQLSSSASASLGRPKSVRIKLSKLDWLMKPISSFFGRSSRSRRKRNRVSSMATPSVNPDRQQQLLAATDIDQKTIVVNELEGGVNETTQPPATLSGPQAESTTTTSKAKGTNRIGRKRTLIGRFLR